MPAWSRKRWTLPHRAMNSSMAPNARHASCSVHRPPHNPGLDCAKTRTIAPMEKMSDEQTAPPPEVALNISQPLEAAAKVKKERYKPLTRLGFAAVEYWVDATKAGKAVDPIILTFGLDGSAIREAEVQVDQSDDMPMIAFRLVTDQGTDKPRLVDVETFAYMRALTAGGGSFRLNPDKPNADGPQGVRYYVEFSIGDMQSSVSLLRLAGDAKPGDEVNQIDRQDETLGHRDYRVRNLKKVAVMPNHEGPRPKQRTKHGRQYAEQRAVAYYAKKRSKAGLWLSTKAYARMLRDLAALIPPVKAA